MLFLPPPQAAAGPRPLASLPLLIAILMAVGVGVYFLSGRSEKQADRGVYSSSGLSEEPDGKFPELQPDIAAPPGYAWIFRDGPDFYTWVLTEPAEAGKRAKSGVGVYVGHHTSPSKTAGTEGRIAGRVCGRDVTWLVERSDAVADPWVRRDVVLEYEYGSGYTPVSLHVWVWGPSEEVVTGLAAQLAGLTFSTHAR